MLPALLASLLAVSQPSAQAANSARLITDEFQAHIVRLYSEGHCDEVRRIGKGADLLRLRPNVMAIAASCEPEGWDAERLFAAAEGANPTGDLIYVLHARFREKKDPESARPLWRKVLLIARNDYFRQMAMDYLDGVKRDEDEDGPLNLSETTLFGQFFLGATHDNNAQLPDFVYLPSAASYGLLPRADLVLRHWYHFGSIAAHYTTSYNLYWTARQYSLWDNNLEIPIAIHVVPEKDIVIRPFSGFSNMGSAPLRFLYGIGVAGVVFHGTYRQSVQGMAYSDAIYVPAIQAQQGAHYRFEYQWAFFPVSWLIDAGLAVEHVSSSPATQLFGSTGRFEMSHTDISMDFKLEHEIGRVTLGFVPRVLYRVDSDDSMYARVTDGVGVTKQRQDWDVTLQPNVTFPFSRAVQLFAWYEWRRIFSNIGPSDYVDRNYRNDTVGLGVKTSLATY